MGEACVCVCMYVFDCVCVSASLSVSFVFVCVYMSLPDLYLFGCDCLPSSLSVCLSVCTCLSMHLYVFLSSSDDLDKWISLNKINKK